MGCGFLGHMATTDGNRKLWYVPDYLAITFKNNILAAAFY